MKVTVVYWSGTGNTKKMAELIQSGANEAGAEAILKEVNSASPSDLENCDVMALGCPSMGAEVLEEYEFEPFVAAIEDRVKGKKLALFGSYGWGDGEWMRDWDRRMLAAGADLITESLIVNEFPSGNDAEQCVAFGKAIAG